MPTASMTSRRITVTQGCGGFGLYRACRDGVLFPDVAINIAVASKKQRCLLVGLLAGNCFWGVLPLALRGWRRWRIIARAGRGLWVHAAF